MYYHSFLVQANNRRKKFYNYVEGVGADFVVTTNNPEHPNAKIDSSNQGTTYDIQARNGVVHLMKKAMIPLVIGGTMNPKKLMSSLIENIEEQRFTVKALKKYPYLWSLTSMLGFRDGHTYFAPTDEAWDRFAAKLDLDEKEELLDQPFLEEILQYSILPNKKTPYRITLQAITRRR